MEKTYDNQGVSLWHGDCLQVMAAALEQGSVDMIFADPPYRLSNDGITCHSGKMVSVNKGDWDRSQGLEQDLQFHLAWIGACRSLLRPGGTLWISGTYHSIYTCGYALLHEGYKILNDICWYKPNAAPNLSCRYFTASHEMLLWAKAQRDASHTFNYELLKTHDWGDDRYKREGRQMRSVWEIPTPGRAEKTCGRHPAQKPLALLRRIIEASTRAGDLILDPFMGSATTGLAARELGRRCIGIELEREFIDLAIRRLEGAAT